MSLFHSKFISVNYHLWRQTTTLYLQFYFREWIHSCPSLRTLKTKLKSRQRAWKSLHSLGLEPLGMGASGVLHWSHTVTPLPAGHDSQSFCVSASNAWGYDSVSSDRYFLRTLVEKTIDTMYESLERAGLHIFWLFSTSNQLGVRDPECSLQVPALGFQRPAAVWEFKEAIWEPVASSLPSHDSGWVRVWDSSHQRLHLTNDRFTSTTLHMDWESLLWEFCWGNLLLLEWTSHTLLRDAITPVYFITQLVRWQGMISWTKGK